MTTTTPIRILCLHGYTQNADVFRKRLAVVSKDLKNVAEFVYINAPHKLPREEPETEAEKLTIRKDEGDGQWAWWRANDSGTVYEGLEESIEYIKTLWSKDQPFHAILGFSQGATMAALVLPSLDPQPLFTMHFSGFIPRAPSAAPYLERIPQSLPSIHVMGRSDTWVSIDRSEELMKCFGEGRKVVIHEGGHFIPTNAEHRRAYKDFITSFLNSMPHDNSAEPRKSNI